MKCLIEAHTSENGRKKKNNLLKQLHNLIAHLRNRKSRHLSHIYMTTHFHWLVPTLQ